MNPFLSLDPSNLDEVLCALIDTPSVSRDEALLCDQLQEWVSLFRPDAKLTRVSNTLVARIGDERAEPIILAGHLDTVPPADYEGTLNTTAKALDGRIYGLGTADMKSGVAVMIALLADIQIPSTFIFYECEEVRDDLNGLKILNESHPELMKGKWAVLLEPTNGDIELGCQGALTLKATYKGTRAHSARPWMGENAIHKSAQAINRAEQASKSQPKVEINGLTYPSTLQLTRVNGGVASNVIPDVCEVTINHRYSPLIMPEQALEYVRANIFEDADEISVSSNFPGAQPAFDHPLVSYAQEQKRAIVPKVAWTDVARFYALGVPALNCGPGHPELCHRADEHIEISKLYETYDFLKSFIEN